MERTPGERTVSFRANLVSPPPSNASVSASNGNASSSSAAAARASSTVAPGYVQLSPSTNNLRVRPVASHRRPLGTSGPSNNRGTPTQGTTGGSGGARSDNNSGTPIGTSPQLASLLKRHGEDPLASLVHRQRSVDSIADLASTASPFTQSPVGAYPGGNFPPTVSRDSATMQELIALQQQQQSHPKGVTVIYPQRVSPSDPHMRIPDYVSMQDAQSVDEDSANEDRVQVRVEGYYEGTNVNVLIPNDLPPSTLLYVLTASDGRDLMFKVTQYSLQLIICFLKTPSIFSPEIQAFTGAWAERLYRNYNTIRHGRSLFKMGRGLLNFFTVQTVWERMWTRYEVAISRQTCAVLLPVVRRVEQALLALGAAPVWGRAMSRQLLHWSQAAELTPAQRRLEESQDAVAMDWRIQERMKETKTPTYPGALLADDTFTHITEVERGGGSSSATGGASASHGHASSDNGGMLQGMANASFTGLAIHKAMHAIGLAGPRRNAGLLPSPPELPGSPAEEDKPTPEHSTKVSPHSTKSSFPTPTSRSAHGTVTAATTPTADKRTSSEAAAVAAASNADADAAKPTTTTATSAATTAPHGKSIVETSTSSSADDASHLHNVERTPPFVHGTMPLLLDGDQLPGMTPSRNTTATANTTAPTTDPNDGSTDEGGGGRQTLLRPLPRPTRQSSTTDPEFSVSGEDGALHEDASSMPTVTAANSTSREPMSMPENWRPAMAPTVPPSHSDDFGLNATLCYAGSPPPPPEKADRTGSHAPTGLMKKALVSSSDGSSAVAVAAARTGVVDDASSAKQPAAAAATTDSPRRSKKGCPPFEMVPAPSLPGSAASSSSSLPALLPPQGGNLDAAELNESEMSILSSEANSSFHVRPNGVSGTMTSWLNELQPASAALPARLRKGVLQFNPVLMTLLGIRNLAAGVRRFLRDATLISTERFVRFTFVEVHRRSITRFINRCWLIVSIIDLILNTVRLLEPGWVKYATARQNIRCRCGCQGDEDPSDTVWRTHGFIARRKTDLFFPPLNLDYGAPFVSAIAYMEAADPARLMPACSRCGCLYKELSSEAAMLDGEEDVPATGAATPGGTLSLSPAAAVGLNRSSPAHASLPSETPFVVPMSRPSQSLSEEGDRSLSTAAALEREKPRWVQMYEAEVQEAEEARRRSGGAAAAAANVNSVSAAAALASTSGSGTKTNAEAEEAGRTAVAVGERADLVQPPSLLQQRSAAGRPPKPLPSHDAEVNLLTGTVSSGDASGKNSTGILFVPWMMRKFFDYVWLLRVHPNLTATLLLEARYLAEFYLSYKYCFSNYESYRGDAPLSAILHPYGAIAGIVSAAVGLLRVVESAPTS